MSYVGHNCTHATSTLLPRYPIGWKSIIGAPLAFLLRSSIFINGCKYTCTVRCGVNSPTYYNLRITYDQLQCTVSVTLIFQSLIVERLVLNLPLLLIYYTIGFQSTSSGSLFSLFMHLLVKRLA